MSCCAIFLGCSSRPPPGAPLGAERAHSAPSSEPIEVPASAAAGFEFPYLLLLPRAASAPPPPFLLVEPNNTGVVSDDFEVHRKAAIALAQGASVGGFVAPYLGVPLLVPIFPRPASAPLTYTHALDRDTVLIGEGPLRRLDLQLIAMIDDARSRLGALGIAVDRQVLLNGFSASGTFVNRFTLLHPERVRGVACGGINGILMLPLASSGGLDLPYPLGTRDITEFGGTSFSLAAWQRVPQLVYMGASDTNDAVAFDDGYSPEERRTVHAVLGARMQPERWAAARAMYRASGANVTFRTYPGIGHGTDGVINTQVAEFFRAVMSSPN